MSKLVLCESSLYNDSLFIGSFKEECTVVNVDAYDNVDAVNVDGVTHIAFAWHYPGYSELPFFHDDNTDLEQPYNQEYRYFSNNLISLFRRLDEGAIVDLLCCNLYNGDFAESVEKVETDLGVNIRYSVDQTGNAPQGNWVMESDGTDVKDVYFTDAIDEWNGVLDDGVNASDIIAASGLFDYDTESKTLKLLRNAIWSDVSNALGGHQNYIQLAFDETFDGQDFVIDLSGVTAFQGLFTCIYDVNESETQRAVIKNLGMLNGETKDEGGFIVRKAQRFFEVNNCYSTGIINGGGAGGICGVDTGFRIDDTYNGSALITNCYSTGIINGGGAGGICGSDAGHNGKCIIKHCYSIGDIVGVGSGGICGKLFGINSSSAIINCYSTGDISANNAGGICGYLTGILNSNQDSIIENCYSIGNISGGGAGGIYGDGNVKNSLSVENCYSQNGTVVDTSQNGLSVSDVSASDICGNVFIDVGPTYSYPVLQEYDGVAMLQIITDTEKTIDISDSSVNVAVINMDSEPRTVEDDKVSLGQPLIGQKQLDGVLGLLIFDIGDTGGDGGGDATDNSESNATTASPFFNFIPRRSKLGAVARVNLPTGLRNIVKRR